MMGKNEIRVAPMGNVLKDITKKKEHVCMYLYYVPVVCLCLFVSKMFADILG